LPFVMSDIEEGANLVRRLYLAQGFLDATVDPPHYTFAGDGAQANVTLAVREGRQYFFGHIAFVGQTIYGDEALLGQILDLINQPYTDARLDDIQRRLQAYFKARGYFEADVKVTSGPLAAPNGRVPVQVMIEPGRLFRFDGVTVSGLQRLRPSYITRRFRRLSGKPYSPDLVDIKFRDLMRTGLFNLLQIKPTPIEGDLLRLDILAEEAKSREFGFSVGYGSFVGGIFGVQYRDRNLFGYGRPLTTSVEISERSYKGEILYEDPYLFDTEYALKARLAALTYDFDGYSKFEVGGRVDLTRQITKQYLAGLVVAARHVEITSNDIHPPDLAGRTNYLVNTVGFTQTLDLRDSPIIPTRGLVVDTTFDLATSGIGSQIDFIRSTVRASYYLSFAKPQPSPSDFGIGLGTSGRASWLEQSSLAFGARTGVIHSLNSSADEALAIPIDERFFNGGSNTVRSFGERELGPRDRHGNPIGGEFFTIFNVEYTFPIFGELQGAIFTDAGNLLPNAEQAGFDDMRYAVGAGLRYKLPIGPIRLDYGVNPNPHPDEDFGAFNFSFGFAF
jgi:outer membrane protein insertion porin family